MTEPLTLKVRAKTGIDDVRQALTDPKTLNLWLGEHSNVDLPGTFEFWGRYIPEGDAPHQRVLEYDGTTLKLAWLLGGVETTTEITLIEESVDSTIVKLSQSHFSWEEAVTGSTIRGVLQTFWSLALANLVDHLEGRELTTRADFTSTELSGEALIEAPADQVYASLTESSKASAWFGYPVDIDARIGGRFAMGGFEAGPGMEIVDLVEGRKMTIDWGAAGISTWELAESGGKTRLTFVMSGFEGTPPYGAWLGWLSGVASLRRFNEQKDWQPIWVD